ncbi:MAG: sigma 54-interacting transcriptional regulator [Candidatus Aminicenantales bacterium]
MKKKPHILAVSEEPSFYSELASTLGKEDCTFSFCKKGEVCSSLNENRPQLIILDADGDEATIRALLKTIKSYDPLIDVIISSESISSEKVMDLISLGASDFLLKPLNSRTIQLLIRKFNDKNSLRRETYLLEKKLEEKYIFQGMVGKSPFMLEVFSLVESCARYFSTILITGATGTGKEMVARALHKLSPVKNRKYVVCDCASMPENLFESELFGYVKGAFTGADKDKKGLFEEAHQGIILLDEIGEIPVSFQSKLLRVLESHQVRPLGSNTTRKVEVRVIAATNRDLRLEIKKGKFREDLFHRLNKVEIYLPLLKNRKEDIPLLVRYFLREYNKKFGKNVKGVSREAQKLFLTYDWPGNVRELENVIESATMLTTKDFLDLPDLPKYLRQLAPSSDTKYFLFEKKNYHSLKEIEDEYISFLLKRNDNNISKTARILNISRTTLYKKINKFKICLPPS